MQQTKLQKLVMLSWIRSRNVALAYNYFAGLNFRKYIAALKEFVEKIREFVLPMHVTQCSVSNFSE